MPHLASTISRLKIKGIDGNVMQTVERVVQSDGPQKILPILYGADFKLNYVAMAKII